MPHVDSLHISVHKGDAAIHLLVEEPTKDQQNEGKQGTVLKAVLIDGGEGIGIKKEIKKIATKAKRHPIEQTMDWIDNSYAFANDEKLKFTAIVVTHWDRDHYNGVTRILQDASSKAKGPGEITWLKWKDGAPETRFYCPMDPEESVESDTKSPGKTPTEPGKDSGKTPPKPKPPGQTLQSKHYKVVPCPEDSGRNIAIKYKKNDPYVFAKYHSASDEDPWEVLGVELFHNRPLTEKPGILTPSQLIQAHGSPEPGLYCVGVRNLNMDRPKPKKPQNVHSSIYGTDGSKKNQSSIAAMVMWPGSPPRVSHYFAGDLDDPRENEVLCWLKKSEIEQMTSVKLSHHGAQSSTPFTLFQDFRPQNTFIPTPIDAMDGHPTWPVILAWHAWAQGLPTAPRLVAGTYPGPILKETEKPGNGTWKHWEKVNISAFGKEKDSKTGKEKETLFGTHIENAFKELNKKRLEKRHKELLSYLDQFHKVPNARVPYKKFPNAPKGEKEKYEKTHRNRKRHEFLLGVMAAIWQQYGFPKEDYHWASCAAYRITGGPLAKKSLLFTRIRSAATTDNGDGQIRYVEQGKTEKQIATTLNSLPELKTTEAIITALLSEGIYGPQSIKRTFSNSTGSVALKPSKKKKLKKALEQPNLSPTETEDWRDMDDYLLEHVRVKKGSIYVPNETNPDDMADTGDDDEEEDDEEAEEEEYDDLLEPVSSSSSETWVEVDTVPYSPVGEEPGWCIYTSELSHEEIARKVSRFERLPFGVLDDFVADLHCQLLWLEERPPEDPQPNSVTRFVKTDEWRCWFVDVLNAKDFAVLNGADRTVNGFSITVAVAPIGKGPAETTPVWLNFSTKTSVLSRLFGSTEHVLPMGLLKEHCVLVMGLESVNRQKAVDLSDLLSFVGLENLQKNLLIKILGALPVKPPSTPEELEGSRNAVWFVPSNDYRTTIRLECPMHGDTKNKLNEFIKPLKLSLGPTSVIARRRSFWTTSGDSIRILSSGRLVFLTEIDIDGIKLEAVFEFNPNITTLTLTLKSETGKALQSLLNWLQSLLPDSQRLDFSDLQGNGFGSSSLSEFNFRRVSLDLATDETSTKAMLLTFRIDMEVCLLNESTPPTLFLLSYTYSKSDGSTVNAKLWCAPPPFPDEALLRLLPDYEDYAALTPVSIDLSEWPQSLDLAALAGFTDLPSFLPTEVLTAELTANKQGIAFSGSMRPKESTGQVPTFRIEEVILQVSYQWDSSASAFPAPQGTFDGFFSIEALLQPPEGSRFGWPTQLTGSVEYSSNPAQWTLTGTVYDLYASTLTQFFHDTDESIQTAVMSIIESIYVRYLNITYQYVKQQASSFHITGILDIGSHHFTLNFEHSSAGWSFSATAESGQNQNVTSDVGSLVNSVAGSDMNLPDFISNIKVQVNDQNKMDLVITKSKPDTGAENMVILLTVKLGNFTIRYIQFREIVPPTLAAATPTHRVLIASINNLPGADIPLVGEIGQPFDEALFMWVQKPSPQTAGLTKSQLDTVNKTLLDLNQLPLPYKVVKKGEPVATDVLLLGGMHFMLMRQATTGNSTVALDYAFNRRKEVKALEGDDVEDKGSRMTPYERNQGPLSIKNIGFKYSTGTSGNQSILSIRLDAFAKIGPLEFALLGLTLGLDFAGTSEEGPLTLHNLPTPEVSLEGLEAGFQRPPIEIAGMLQYKNTTGEKSFSGALVASFLPWRFQAAGYYGLIQKPDSNQKFKTFFLYCLLQGPLMTFAFATIEGVCGGFGYNSNLKFPTPQNVKKFPLISNGDSEPPTGDGPSSVMDELLATRWFFPHEGSFWVAAGLTVKAFEILTVQAVLVVQWNPEVEIGIFGLATASIPGGKATRQFAHVELGITATLSFRTGVMKIEGELTPASFILDPSCHLLGGFALYTWFDDNGNDGVKGDWVFTIGGFHPLYKKPPQYPNPPRLGISWQFSSAISISGQAYFAITPKVCMGGGRLDVALSMSPLYAYFNAFVDFLINFKPFSFIAEGGLTVGVSFTLDLWIISTKINVEIAARLYIEGPPVRGRVHVDFWVFGFDVNFGVQNQGGPAALSLDEFIEVVCQTHTSGMPTLNLPTNVRPEVSDPDAHVFAVQEGLIPQEKVKSTPSGGDTWKVRAATFEFSIACKFAIEKAIVITPTSKGDVEREVAGTGNSIFAKPMCLTSPLKSTLRVTIKPDEAYILDQELPTEPLWETNQSQRKDVPLALWGKYDYSSDPSYNKNSTSLLTGTKDKSVDLMMGVHISKPSPLPSADKTVPYNGKFQIQRLRAGKHINLPSESTPAFKPIPSTYKKQWDDVKKVFEEKEDAAKQTVDLWKSLGLAKLGWTGNKVGSATGLTGSKPQKMVDDLPKYYLRAPLLSGL